jgi:hypothetical protein
MKQYRICLASNNQWTAWANLDVPFPVSVVHASDILNIQFSAELTVPETVQFWHDHRLT